MDVSVDRYNRPLDKDLHPLESAAIKSPFVKSALEEVMGKYRINRVEDLTLEQREEVGDLVCKKVCSIFKAG